MNFNTFIHGLPVVALGVLVGLLNFAVMDLRMSPGDWILIAGVDFLVIWVCLLIVMSWQRYTARDRKYDAMIQKSK